MSRYDPSEPVRDTTFRDALNAAGKSVGHWGTAEKAVVAFLEHLDEHYVGDYYIEGALGHLLTMTRETLKAP